MALSQKPEITVMMDSSESEAAQILAITDFLSTLKNTDNIIQAIADFSENFFQMSNIHLLLEDIHTANNFVIHTFKKNKTLRRPSITLHNIKALCQKKFPIHISELTNAQLQEYAPIINPRKEQYIFPLEGKLAIIGLFCASFKKKLEGPNPPLQTWFTLISPYIENMLLSQLVQLDRMTKLYDHHSFMNRLETELHRAKRHQHNLTLALLDIDFFKKFNDTYGHQTGDMILIELAKFLSLAVRKTDIIARYGGEEFALSLPETSLIQGLRVVNKIHKQLKATQLIPTIEQITISIGISSLYHAGANTSHQLIHHADKALYQSKANGRNRITIYES